VAREGQKQGGFAHETVEERFGFASFEDALTAYRNQTYTELVPGEEAEVIAHAARCARDLQYEVENIVRDLERAAEKAAAQEPAASTPQPADQQEGEQRD
jgi:hypothetical protein